ncbi:MAG: NAD kinase [Bacteroidota bacterium]
MSKVAIHGHLIVENSIDAVNTFIDRLKREKKEIFVSQILKDKNQSLSFDSFPTYTPRKDMQSFEFIASLGGDGTLLETITHVGSSELPIMGINTGRLGFLATISKDNLNDTLDLYFRDEYDFDERTLLKFDTDDDLFEGKNFALNEFSIIRKDTSSMIVIECYLDGEYLNTYWADGLMVSTPTGSTGYSLSCGGPIIMPHTKNFIITPVSPHNLNVRPLIISEESKLTFKIKSKNQSFLVSLDSRSESIDHSRTLSVSKADFTARLIRIKGISFLDTLRTKLTWGLDKRN